MQPRATLELALIGEKENLPHMHIDMAARSDYNNITLTDEHKRLTRLLGVAAFCWNNAFLRGASQVGIVWHQIMQSVMEYDADVCRLLCLTSFFPSCLVFRHTAAFCAISFSQYQLTPTPALRSPTTQVGEGERKTVEVDPNEQAVATEDIQHRSERR